MCPITLVRTNTWHYLNWYHGRCRLSCCTLYERISKRVQRYNVDNGGWRYKCFDWIHINVLIIIIRLNLIVRVLRVNRWMCEMKMSLILLFCSCMVARVNEIMYSRSKREVGASHHWQIFIKRLIQFLIINIQWIDGGDRRYTSRDSDDDRQYGSFWKAKTNTVFVIINGTGQR